jgi:hypothetical protein
MMGQAIEQDGGHLGAAKDARPFGKAEVRGDDRADAFIEFGQQMEQAAAAGY